VYLPKLPRLHCRYTVSSLLISVEFCRHTSVKLSVNFGKKMAHSIETPFGVVAGESGKPMPIRCGSRSPREGAIL